METQSENQRSGVPQNSPETRLWRNTNTTSTHTVTHWRGTRSFLERFTLFFYFLRLLDTFVWQVCVLGWTDTFFFRSQSCIQTARNSMCSYRNVFLWRCLKMSSSQLKNSQKTLWVIEMPTFALKTGSELYWRSRSFTKWGPALEDTQELLLIIIQQQKQTKCLLCIALRPGVISHTSYLDGVCTYIAPHALAV